MKPKPRGQKGRTQVRRAYRAAPMPETKIKRRRSTANTGSSGARLRPKSTPRSRSGRGD